MLKYNQAYKKHSSGKYYVPKTREDKNQEKKQAEYCRKCPNSSCYGCPFDN